LALNAAGAAAAARYQSEAKHYMNEQTKLKSGAETVEKVRDDKSVETNALMEKHHIFAYGVTFVQVAIALSAITALTRRRPM
jgi:hypothetical protein